MQLTILMEDFPMLFLNMLVEDLGKRAEDIKIEALNDGSVCVSFSSEDIVKVQEIAILCDKYRFGDPGGPITVV